jgi:hypothetical protein
MSRLNAELGSLFIHVPKCAGTSMSSFAWNQGNGHDTVADYDKRGELAPDLFVWAFVRNPWDRIACAYEDCPEVRPEAPTFRHFIERLHTCKNQFIDLPWIRYVSLTCLGFTVGRIHWLPMHLCLRDLSGDLRPDFIGKVETINDDWDHVCQSLGVPNEGLPRLNPRESRANRTRTPLPELYDTTLVDMVGEIYAQDVDLFGYSYEP